MIIIIYLSPSAYFFSRDSSDKMTVASYAVNVAHFCSILFIFFQLFIQKNLKNEKAVKILVMIIANDEMETQ